MERQYDAQVMSSRLSEETGRLLGGRYRLVAPVGVGTSSRVFLAVDTQLRRRVAVKLLHEALAEDEAFLRRFRAEARAAGALSHPNIVAVFDWGEDREDGAVVPYLVTEYLGGGSLRDVLDRSENLTPSQALMVGLDSARALAHAHQRGLVHRDVKPANLLFDEEGRLRLADFGLARALAEASWTEPSGIAVGTARYASPEQALGRRLDGRSDVYSLALVLVESVTGSVPFTADSTAGTLSLRTQGDLELGPEMGGLRSILERAGRLDAAERPQAAELEIGLMACAEDFERPEPLPLVPTLGDGEQTSELHLVRGLSGISLLDADAGEPKVIPAPAPEVLDDGPDEDELLAASRPSSFGPVEPLVGASSSPEFRPASLAPPAALPSPKVAANEPDTSSTRTPRRRRVVAVVVVLALIAAAAAGWWFLVRVPVHEVADFSGQPVTEATVAAQELGFVVDDDTVDRSDGTTPGDVLAQSPGPGATLAEGETLRLTVSLGPTLQVVPAVAALPESEARTQLESAGFVVGAVTRAADEEVAVDAVISATPGPDQEPVDDEGRLPKESSIDLVVSDGPAPRVVPTELQGTPADDAAAALTAIQLDPVRAESFSDSVPAGYVISVSEAAGTELARNTPVRLEVSKGPAPVAIPDILYNTGSLGAQTLEEQGFAVAGIEGAPSGMVLATDPPAGELHQRGTAVRIFTRS